LRLNMEVILMRRALEKGVCHKREYNHTGELQNDFRQSERETEQLSAYFYLQGKDEEVNKNVFEMA